MKATIVNFRSSRHTQTDNQMVLKVDGVDSKDKAQKLVGKDVVWKTPSKKEAREIRGKVSAAHGNKGAIRVIFERGMPGQSVGTKVEVR